MQRYGLQLRKKPPALLSWQLSPHPLVGSADVADDDIKAEILCQASKNRALQKVEERHKKAMDKGPSVFDYDGIYDQIKEEITRPMVPEKIDHKV